jgi:hypothetical protein
MSKSIALSAPKKGKTKRFTQQEVQRIVSNTIEASINGMSTWLNSDDCIVSSNGQIFDDVTLDVKDKEGNKLYAEIHKQLKSKGIEFSI